MLPFIIVIRNKLEFELQVRVNPPDNILIQLEHVAINGILREPIHYESVLAVHIPEGPQFRDFQGHALEPIILSNVYHYASFPIPT